MIGSESDFGGGRVWKVTADSQTDAGDALFAEIADCSRLLVSRRGVIISPAEGRSVSASCRGRAHAAVASGWP